MTVALVGGRYRVGALLGSGGTASVYRATAPDGQPVAVKLLHPHFADSPAVWDAFFEEARAAQTIAHHGVARVLDHGVDEGETTTVWIAMEFVEGRTLAQVVGDSGALTPSDTAQLAEGLLAALAAAHRGGVVHRDVSPMNIMLDPRRIGEAAPALRRTVRLLDFGLADIPGRSTAGSDALLSGVGAHAGVVASVPYAAPEHLRGEAVSESSDVYQAACSLFFALTGRPPFTGPREGVIRAHLHAPVPAPSALRPGISAAVDRWLVTALAKDPAARFADAAAMLAAMPPGLATSAPDALVVATAPTLPGGVEPTRLLPVAGAPEIEGIPRHQRARPRTAGWWVAAAGGLAIAGIVAVAAAAGPGAAPSALASATPSATPSSAPGTPSATPTADAGASPELFGVPELQGLSLAEASSLLESFGFQAGPATRVDAASPADSVISSDPVAGTRVPRGSAIALRIASGNNAVPPTSGLGLQDAIAALSAAGFTATVEAAVGGEPNTVAGSEPAAGASHPLGTTVVLRVNRAAPTPAPTAPGATPGPTPTSSPAPTATPGPGDAR